MKNIGLTISRLRRERGMTQTRLAEYLGISVQAVSKWENGKSMPDLTLIPRIAECLCVNIGELFEVSKPFEGKEKLLNEQGTLPTPKVTAERDNELLLTHWDILQDVNDTCEHLELYADPDKFHYNTGAQLSEWEPLPALKHLQLLYAEHPYWGRELRYFNQAPWWYRTTFILPQDGCDSCLVCFTNVDYYCKVWLNGVLLGEHEGYSAPFSFRADDAIIRGGVNSLVVRVWSPFDTAIHNNNYAKRSYRVLRQMVKGTYEHSDTFIQRDINPVGIYGSVHVKFSSAPMLGDTPDLSYTLSDDLRDAEVTVRVPVVNREGSTCTAELSVVSRESNAVVARERFALDSEETATLRLSLSDIRLWSTWDHGDQPLYDVTVKLMQGDTVTDETTVTTGFKRIELLRTEQETGFYINGKKRYARAVSYFPDYYVSAMTRERYLRDLLAIKAAGFNVVRMHVHVGLPAFYELCSQLGLLIVQDSEFNWQHPFDDAYSDRFVKVFRENVRWLKSYAAIGCWVCMNEPGMGDVEKPINCQMMRPGGMGDKLVKMVEECDGMHPYIKGSFLAEDPQSGDSHNYTGSLYGGRYVDIYGTEEKLNTEFGYDALPCEESLRKEPILYAKEKAYYARFHEIQDYQYHLIKYYIEHYRMQKYAPNAGYGLFLFSDIAPNSYFGIYDWWGIPKKGLQAVLESNMPIGVFLKYRDNEIEGIYAANDTDEAVEGELRLVLTDSVHNTLSDTVYGVKLDADGAARVADAPTFERPTDGVVHAYLTLKRHGKTLAKNHYHDILTIRPPVRLKNLITHEQGLRVFDNQ